MKEIFTIRRGDSVQQRGTTNLVMKFLLLPSLFLIFSFDPREGVSAAHLTSPRKTLSTKIEPCKCNSVIDSIFWSGLMPSYFICGGEMVCILKNMDWYSNGMIHLKPVIQLLEMTDPNWLSGTNLIEEAGFCVQMANMDIIGISEDSPAEKRTLESFLGCFQKDLSKYLCKGCISKYWNFFRKRMSEFAQLDQFN
ncbi:uncharacterized protein [Lepeophtheirus salmonis]|uniref:Uncharacterized protein n=1 Tax=Lepeophtheirus salmonis TaxID=72036 RepID=A0A0K2SZ65_LEPSM